MASTADHTPDTKAVAAAEKTHPSAAADNSVSKAVEAPRPAKIDVAVAEVKAAPKKTAKPARVAKKTLAKKAAPKKAVAPKKPAALRSAKAQPVAAKPVAAPKRALPTITQLKDKIMANTQTTDFTNTVKTVAADAQTRAKAAYDRFQSYAGEMTDMTKGNVEALVEAGKILGSGVQDMARGEVEAAKGAYETLTADLKAMAAIKNPTELFKLQGEIARRNFDAAVARAAKNAEVSLKLVNDAFAPISSRMSIAAERLSNAA
jgi:phasin family protein